MIPTLLLVGLVVGAFVHDWASLGRSTVAGIVVSILWGVGVGAIFGGTAFALANVLVGAAIATATRSLLRLTLAGVRTRMR